MNIKSLLSKFLLVASLLTALPSQTGMLKGVQRFLTKNKTAVADAIVIATASATAGAVLSFPIHAALNRDGELRSAVYRDGYRAAWLMLKLRANPNAKEDYKYTLLHHTACNGKKKMELYE